MSRAKIGRPRTAGDAGSGDPRRDVLAAAGRLFAAKGVAATSMADIASEAGLRPPSLYYWFRGKTAILSELVAEANRIPLQVVAEVEAAGGPVPVRLWQVVCLDVEALCRFDFDINEIHRLVADESEAATTYWADRRRLIEAVEALVAEGIGAGELRPVDAHLAALTILANDEGSQNWYRPMGPHQQGHRYEPRQIGSHLADLTLSGLLARPAELDAVRRQALAGPFFAA